MKRTGSVFSRGEGKDRTWWARLIYTDEGGKRRDLQRRATSKAKARELVDKLIKDFDPGGERVINSERMTFDQLANYCEKHYYKEA